MRQVTEQKPQRSTVSSPSSGHRASVELTKRRPGSRTGGSSGSGHGSGNDEPRTFPPMALGLMLVVGILIGLLFAALISSFVNGGASGTTDGVSAKPTPSPSGHADDVQAQQHTDEIRENATPEARDVRILGCGVDSNGYASARVLITNSTDKTATYYVRVVFTGASDGRNISDDVASAKDLPPGATAPLKDVNAVDSAPGQDVLCRLGSVSRF
jgi:hypothetical protein